MATIIQQIEANRRVKRMQARESQVFDVGITAKDLVPLLEQIGQTRRRLERTYATAKRELERLQKARRRQNSSAPGRGGLL
jgi:hypothetical protein